MGNTSMKEVSCFHCGNFKGKLRERKGIYTIMRFKCLRGNLRLGDFGGLQGGDREYRVSWSKVKKKDGSEGFKCNTGPRKHPDWRKALHCMDYFDMREELDKVA